MNEEQEIAETAEKRELYNAFGKESSDAIKPFREFWRKSGATMREESRKLDAVLGGGTPVVDQLVAEIVGSPSCICTRLPMRPPSCPVAASQRSRTTNVNDIVVRAIEVAKKAPCINGSQRPSARTRRCNNGVFLADCSRSWSF